jgi:hypothetical protein
VHFDFDVWLVDVAEPESFLQAKALQAPVSSAMYAA